MERDEVSTAVDQAVRSLAQEQPGRWALWISYGLEMLELEGVTSKPEFDIVLANLQADVQARLANGRWMHGLD